MSRSFRIRSAYCRTAVANTLNSATGYFRLLESDIRNSVARFNDQLCCLILLSHVRRSPWAVPQLLWNPPALLMRVVTRQVTIMKQPIEVRRKHLFDNFRL